MVGVTSLSCGWRVVSEKLRLSLLVSCVFRQGVTYTTIHGSRAGTRRLTVMRSLAIGELGSGISVSGTGV